LTHNYNIENTYTVKNDFGLYFLNELSKKAEEKKYSVEYLIRPFDFNHLDGIIIKELKTAVLNDSANEPVILENIINGETCDEETDVVFICAGTVPQSAVAGSMAALDKEGYIITDMKMATNTPGLYAAGDVRAGAFRQVVTACADGAVAAHNAAGYIDEVGSRK